MEIYVCAHVNVWIIISPANKDVKYFKNYPAVQVDNSLSCTC